MIQCFYTCVKVSQHLGKKKKNAEAVDSNEKQLGILDEILVCCYTIRSSR